MENTFSDEELKKKLSPEEYKVLRKKGTEPAFSSDLHANKEEGMYVCKVCGTPVFSSDYKFDSGTGWPSFDRPVGDSVGTEIDKSFFTTRTEVHCKKCGSHLGHVFNDGPDMLPNGKKGRGQRYCINGISLGFKNEK